MNRVTIDASLRARLADLSRPLAFEDETGKVIGIFTPVDTSHKLYEESEIPPITEEDLKRWRAMPKGQPLKEILAELEIP